MSRIHTSGCWKKTVKGWRYIGNDDDRKVTNRYLEPSLKVASLDTTHVCSTISVAWQCIIAYITSPTDLRNLAATCRLLYKLVESELGWSYLIRTKFGYHLWLRHVRQIFHQQNNQQINLHADIETMGKSELVHRCAILPATFLLNRAEGHSIPVARAILRSYQYHLEIEVSRCTVYIDPSQYIFRHLISFKNVYSEHLSDAQRRTIPLAKLIYFYLADQRHLPVVKFSIMRPRENVKEISDSKASTGRALQLNTCGRMIVLHPYHSIMPGRYEIFWRLRFTSLPIAGDNLEFIAVPQYGLMTREHTSSKQFTNCLDKYGKNYFRRSMGIITVFKRCAVFVGCIDLTRWQQRTTFVLDYIEMTGVV